LSSTIAPFSSHLNDLRTLIFKICFIIIFGTSFSFIFSESIFQTLIAPYRAVAPDKEIKQHLFRNETATQKIIILHKDAHVKQLYNGILTPDSVTLNPGGILETSLEADPQTLVLFGPLEGFRITFWISFLGGILLTFPFWSLLIVKFIVPALHPEEKRALAPLGFLSFLFLIAALTVAHTTTLPWMNQILLDFNRPIGTNLWGVESYLDYVLGLYIAHIVFFELALLLFFLVYRGVIKSDHLKSGRRYAYLSAFVLGAFLTPPDIFSQLCVAIPLIGFYELAAAWALLINGESGRK